MWTNADAAKKFRALTTGLVVCGYLLKILFDKENPKFNSPARRKLTQVWRQSLRKCLYENCEKRVQTSCVQG